MHKFQNEEIVRSHLMVDQDYPFYRIKFPLEEGVKNPKYVVHRFLRGTTSETVMRESAFDKISKDDKDCI